MNTATKLTETITSLTAQGETCFCTAYSLAQLVGVPMTDTWAALERLEASGAIVRDYYCGTAIFQVKG